MESHFCGDDKWSLDACVGYALAHKLFKRSEMLCTKTLYSYVELGLLGIKNIDLPQKLHRRTKAKRIRERKRVLGRSIEERPESVDSREEFGHWEIDEVIGRKSDRDQVLLTMVERKTRNLCVLRLADKSSRSLMEAFQRMEDELGQDFPKVFRSITADNGSENAMLAEIESVTFLPGFPSLGLIFVGGLVLFELNQKSPGRTAFQRILHRTTKLNHGNHLICSYSHLYYKFKSNLAPHSGVVNKYHLMEKVGSKPSFFSIKRFSADLIASSRISFKSSSEMPFRTSSSPN